MTEVETAFLIADLSGYSALTEAHGALEAAKVVDRFVAMATDALTPDVRVVERVGDELLIAATDAAALVSSAVSLREAIEHELLFPAMRAGLHAGPVLEREGRYYGAALNLTARVAGHARGGQVLCTEPIALRARGRAEVEFRLVGPVRFRNVLEPVVVYEITAGHPHGGVIDPVCRMKVTPDTAPARLPYGGETYHFCSFECARAFAARPQDYAPRG